MSDTAGVANPLLFLKTKRMGQTMADMEEKFRSFLTNIDDYAMSVIESSDPQLIEKIQNQLMQGKDGDGDYLRPYMWEGYREFKLTLNPLGVTDWRLTGDFYNHMKMRILNKKEFSFYSDGTNTNNLIKIYGTRQMEEAMTVSDDSVLEFREERFNPFFVELLCAYTGARMITV